MARHEINIELRANGSNAVSEFGKVGKASRDLIVYVKKIGNVFGEGQKGRTLLYMFYCISLSLCVGK